MTFLWFAYVIVVQTVRNGVSTTLANGTDVIATERFSAKHDEIFTRNLRVDANADDCIQGLGPLNSREDHSQAGNENKGGNSISLTHHDMFTYLSEMKGQHLYLEGYSCTNNMCGKVQNGRCSCQPSCVALKTCCMDFYELCTDDKNFWNEIASNFSWLQGLVTECYMNNIVVTSCPIGESRQFQYNLSKINRTTDDIYQQLHVSINPMDQMRLLASGADVSQSLSGEVEWLLTNIPVEDTMAGVSFINASVFDCNSAHWPSAKPWTFATETLLSGLLSSRRIKSIESIISFLNTSSHIFYKSELSNPCLPDVISTCPRDYPDHTIRENCENTTLSIRVLNMAGDPSSAKYFKNPFCQHCHDMGKSRLPVVYEQLIKPVIISFEHIKMEVSNEIISIEAHPSFRSRMPAWKNLACNITLRRSTKDENNFAPLINRMGRSSIEDYTTCAVTKCQLTLTAVPPFDTCYINERFVLLLPSAAKRLTTTELQKIMGSLAYKFSIFMGEWNANVTYYNVEVEEGHYKFREMDFQYIVMVRLKLEGKLVSFDSFVPWDDLPRVLWSGSKFPLRSDSLRFCVVMSKYGKVRPAVDESRCWSIPFDSRALIYDGLVENRSLYLSPVGLCTVLVVAVLVAREALSHALAL